MKPIEYRHTLAVYHKIREDLKRLTFKVTILVQFFLFIYYSCTLYFRRHDLVYVILYSILLVISLLLFIEECLYQSHRKTYEESEIKPEHRKKRLILKIISLSSKISLLVLSLITILQNKATDFEKVMTIALCIILLVQFILLFLARLINKYLSWAKKAIELDYKESLLKSPSQTFTDKLHDIATKLKKDEDKDEFHTIIQEQLKKDEDEKSRKKALDRLKKKEQRKEDLKTIKEHFKDKYIQSRMKDEKISSSYRKNELYAKKCLNDPNEYKEFLDKAIHALEKEKLPSQLDYLQSELDNLLSKTDITDEEKTKAIINLHYYLNPLLKNEKTIQDNLKIKKLTEMNYSLVLKQSNSD